MKEVDTPAEVVMATDVTEKELVADIPSLLVTVSLTEPVKPFAGVTVKETPVAVAPGFNNTAPVKGVN
jgi:hypothetical protein